MDARAYMVGYVMGGRSIWNTEYFFDEESARKCANEAWKNGARKINLCKKDRAFGYRVIKVVERSAEEAQNIVYSIIKRRADELGAKITFHG